MYMSCVLLEFLPLWGGIEISSIEARYKLILLPSYFSTKNQIRLRSLKADIKKTLN